MIEEQIDAVEETEAVEEVVVEEPSYTEIEMEAIRMRDGIPLITPVVNDLQLLADKFDLSLT